MRATVNVGATGKLRRSLCGVCACTGPLERQVHTEALHIVEDAEAGVGIVDAQVNTRDAILEPRAQADALLVGGERVAAPQREDVHERVFAAQLDLLGEVTRALAFYTHAEGMDVLVDV